MQQTRNNPIVISTSEAPDSQRVVCRASRPAGWFGEVVAWGLEGALYDTRKHQKTTSRRTRMHVREPHDTIRRD